MAQLPEPFQAGLRQATGLAKGQIRSPLPSQGLNVGTGQLFPASTEAGLWPPSSPNANEHASGSSPSPEPGTSGSVEEANVQSLNNMGDGAQFGNARGAPGVEAEVLRRLLRQQDQIEALRDENAELRLAVCKIDPDVSFCSRTKRK